MAFTYDPSTDIGAIRLEIGDENYGAGVKPSGKNFTDAEIQLLLTREGSTGRAAAGLCEILARHWAHLPDSASVGGKTGRSRSNNQVNHFRDLGKELRQQYGGNATAFSTGFQRDDGFHQNNEFDEDTTDGEFSAHRTIYIRE